MSDLCYKCVNMEVLGNQTQPWWIRFIRKSAGNRISETDTENMFNEGVRKGLFICSGMTTSTVFKLSNDEESVLAIITEMVTKGIFSENSMIEISDRTSLPLERVYVIFMILGGLGYIGPETI